MPEIQRLYPIGELARRTGLRVRTIRFWSDSGIVAPSARTSSGHRLYDDEAAARLELVATLRQLGLGLEVVRSVLDKRRTLAEVAGVHARAIETEIRALRMRRAVLVALASRGADTKEMMMINNLARLSAAERRQLVDEFVDEVFGEPGDGSGIGERMRMATPALPDDPSDEQVQAWVEVATLVQDPAFRARVRQMAEAGGPQAGRDEPDGKALAARVAEHAGPAVEQGVDPASPEAVPVLERIFEDLDPAERAGMADRLATFADARVDRYWRLVGTINGWPPFPPAFGAFQWVIEALRGHGSARAG